MYPIDHVCVPCAYSELLNKSLVSYMALRTPYTNTETAEKIRTKYLVAIQWHSYSVKETCLNSTYKSIEGPTSRRGMPTSARRGSTSRPKANKSRHSLSAFRAKQ